MIEEEEYEFEMALDFIFKDMPGTDYVRVCATSESKKSLELFKKRVEDRIATIFGEDPTK